MSTSPQAASACKNCDNTFTGEFCNYCGQRHAHRLTVSHLLHEAVHVMLHADKGVFPFIRRVVVEPGVMAKEFVAGKRRMFNPIQFFVLSIGVIVTLMALTDFFVSLERYQQETTKGLTGPFLQHFDIINRFVRKYTNLFSAVMLPCFALFCWLFFRKRGYNYAESFMVIIFCMCQVNVLNIASLIVAYLLHLGFGAIASTTFILVFLSFSLGLRQFYGVRWVRAALGGVGIYLCTVLVQAVVMVLLTFGIMYFHPIKTPGKPVQSVSGGGHRGGALLHRAGAPTATRTN